MSKKKQVRKKIGSRLAEGEAAFVVCVKGKCCSREEARTLLDDARALAPVGVVVAPFGCLGVCKKGPIVATVRAGKKKVKLRKHVDADRARSVLLALSER